MRRTIRTLSALLLLGAFLFVGTMSATAIMDPFVPADNCNALTTPVGIQAVQNGGLDPPGAANDGVNNPAGVGAGVAVNNPGQGGGFSGGATGAGEQGSTHC